MIKTLLDYNLWANKRIASVLPEDKADVEVASSFNSIRKTILHSWDAETIWLQRIRGQSPKDWPSKVFNGNFKEAVAGWIKQSETFSNYIQAVPETDFSKSISFTTIKGDEYQQSLSEILHHVTNHSSFHRGQLVTMMRSLGHEAALPSTDMIVYFREANAR